MRPTKSPGSIVFVCTMGMVGVTGPDTYQMIIVDHEATEGDVRRIVVFTEGKAVVRLGPISAGEEALLCPTQIGARGGGPRRTHCFSIA